LRSWGLSLDCHGVEIRHTQDIAMKLQVTVEADDPATASRQSQALQRLLLEEGLSATIERVRTNDETLDGGTTLAVILASPVLLELARCLRMFLQRHNASEITITDEHGSVIAKNVSAATVSEVTRMWSAKRDAE
jgi:hypothetical protein